MMKLTLLAVILIVGAYGCNFKLEDPKFSDVTSQTTEYRLTTDESIANITEKIINIQTTLGFNNLAQIKQIAVGIVDYINRGDIGSGKTLGWNFTESKSLGVIKAFHISAIVTQSGARRILSITGKSLDILQKIPEVFHIKKVCEKIAPIRPIRPTIPVKLPVKPTLPKLPTLPVKPTLPPKAPVQPKPANIPQLKQLIQKRVLPAVQHDDEFCHRQKCKYVKEKRELTPTEKTKVTDHMFRFFTKAFDKLVAA